MRFNLFLQRLIQHFTSSTPAPRRRRHARKRSFKPRIECLEDRLFLAVDLQGYATDATDKVQWGQTINISSQVRNGGLGAAAAFQVQWYLSKDTVGGNSDDILLAHPGGNTGYGLPAIPANSHSPTFAADRVLPSALPSGWSGTVFHVMMKTDSAKNNPNETNESNNFGQMGQGKDRDSITITTPPSDLQGSATSATDSGSGARRSTSRRKSVMWGRAAAAFQVQWYLSKDTVGGNGDDILLAHPGGNTGYGLPAIPANSYSPTFAADRVLPSALPSGWSGTVFHVIMKTDSANNNPNETNENNNFGQMGQGKDRDSITITTPPSDLQGSATSATDRRGGKTINISSQVRNAGSGAAAAIRAVDRPRTPSAATATISSSPIRAETRIMTFRRLPANSYSPTFAADRVLPSALPSGWSGTVFHVIMKTDSANNNPNETNENNNFGQMGQGKDRDSITITTPPSDLQGSATSATDSAQWGQTINISSQVRNAGSGAAAAYQVQWYLSKDTIGGNSDDILLAHPGGNTNMTFRGSPPTVTAPRSRRIACCPVPCPAVGAAPSFT